MKGHVDDTCWEIARAAFVHSMGGYRFLTLQKNCPPRWGPDLRHEYVYAASCLAFCALGAWAIGCRASVCAWLGGTTGWPYFSERMLLIHGCADVLQGLLSFSSDVVLVDVPSAVHLADRALAVLLTLLGVYIEVTVLLFSGLSVPLRTLMAALLAGALVHHFQAKAAISQQIYQTYVRSHTLWHLGICASLPLPVSLAIGRSIFGL